MRSLISLVLVLMFAATVHAGAFGVPCTLVTAENSALVRDATDIAVAAKTGRTMAGCRVEPGTMPTLTFGTHADNRDHVLFVFSLAVPVKGPILFIFSKEVEAVMSPQALRGLVGHEIGHLVAEDHNDGFWRELTPEQKLDREADADAAAAALVGTEAIREAMDEYQDLFRSMMRRAEDSMKAELDIRRTRLTRLTKTSRR